MIVCAGEALIDMLPRETAAGEKAFAPYPGGAVFNTAVALGRLGTKAGFVSGISTDMFGEILSDALTASSVESLAHRSGRPTTLAFVTLQDGQAQYAFYDENTAGRMLSISDLPQLPKDACAMFFGGISLAVEPCGTAYEALMKREVETKVTMIDPNIRPGFISDERAFRARIGRMISMADIVKLSDEDIRWLLGTESLSALAREVLRMGAKLVCITEGAKGAWAISEHHEVFVEAEPVETVDTVGAGDTFNAGVLAALDQSSSLTKNTVANLDPETMKAAVSQGCRAAAITVSRAGANPPWRHEL